MRYHVVMMMIALTAGCSTTGSENMGLANPASVYCAKLGGVSTIINQASGQVGICSLPDGQQVEEWELYRRDHPHLNV